MSNSDTFRSLPGSCIEFCETQDKLTLQLHGIPQKAAIAGVLITIFYVFGLILLLPSEPIYLRVVAITVLTAAWLLALCFFLSNYLNETLVSINRDKVRIIAALFGQKGEEREHPLDTESFAKEHVRTSFHKGSRRQHHCGIEITNGEEVVTFGGKLRQGEIDWVQWRINRFLGHPEEPDVLGDGLLRIEDLPQKPTLPPARLGTRIKEHGADIWFEFPNSLERGSIKGTGLALFGLTWTYLWLSRVFTQAPKPEPAGIVFLLFFATIGVLLTFVALVRLFGFSRLWISPNFVRFQSTLFGIGPYWRFPIGQIVSVQSAKDMRTRTGRIIERGGGYKIRTARREIAYFDYLRDAARSSAEQEWIAGEVALRIYTARAGTTVLPIRNRQIVKECEAHPSVLPKPVGKVPYEIHKRSLPSDTRLNAILPARVGVFACPADDSELVCEGSYEVEYVTDAYVVTLTLDVCADVSSARQGVAIAASEASDSNTTISKESSLSTEPSFCRITAEHNAFFAWNRGTYFFTASAHGFNCEQALDAFMKAFPY